MSDEPSPIIPASLGAREAMPGDDFMAKVHGMDFDRLISPITTAHAKATVKDQQAIDALAAMLWLDPATKPFFEWIFDMTLRQPVFVAGLGDQAFQQAILQEGRNQVAWRILQAIARGRDEAPPHRSGL